MAAPSSIKGAFETDGGAEPSAVFEVRHRGPHKGARWRTVGTAASYAEALALVRGSGDYHITERREGECKSSG